MVATLKNKDIYSIAAAVLEEVKEDLNLPVKITYYFQRNITTIVALGREIENARNEVLAKYGTFDEESQQYTFEDQDKVDAANEEINAILDQEQEVEIKLIPLAWFDGVKLTTAQVSAISFMLLESDEVG